MKITFVIMTAKNREENLELPYKIAGKQPPKEWWRREEDKRSGLRGVHWEKVRISCYHPLIPFVGFPICPSSFFIFLLTQIYPNVLGVILV